jgi:patatin-like phospholipase/acyl hydrolase
MIESVSQLDFNPQHKKTILTVDGGGVRGIIPLMALLKLERDSGRPCRDLFDFVGGTSVGALIAGAIAVGKSAAEIVEIYQRFVHAIFKMDYVAIAFRHGFRYLYDKTALRGLLRDTLGDVRLNDLPVAVLFTVKDVARGETIFFVNRGPGAAATGHARLAQVIEASAAAPIYFEPVGDGVDGGVGVYGNTCYVATVEAMEYMSRGDPGWRDGNVIHCSFGTEMSSERRSAGRRGWLPLRCRWGSSTICWTKPATPA